MMNKDKKRETGFLGKIDSRDAHLTTPDAPPSAQDDIEEGEDNAADERLRRVIADIDEMEGELAGKSEGYGELPFDEGADRERWERLENEVTELLVREAEMKKSEDVKNFT